MSEDQEPMPIGQALGITYDAIANIVENVAKVAVFVAERYAEAGMPYGATSEGLFLWIMTQRQQQEENGQNIHPSSNGSTC